MAGNQCTLGSPLVNEEERGWRFQHRAAKLGVPFQVIERAATDSDELGEGVTRLGNERIVEAIDPTSGIVLHDKHGELKEWYRAVITEPPMGHTEADRAALAAHPITRIGRVNLVPDPTT